MTDDTPTDGPTPRDIAFAAAFRKQAEGVREIADKLDALADQLDGNAEPPEPFMEWINV
jgi:hypothetical protein